MTPPSVPALDALCVLTLEDGWGYYLPAAEEITPGVWDGGCSISSVVSAAGITDKTDNYQIPEKLPYFDGKRAPTPASNHKKRIR